MPRAEICTTRRTPAAAQASNSAMGASACMACSGRPALSRSTPTALITASMPARCGSQASAVSAGKIQRGAVRRLRCTGSWPACFRLSTIWRPMNPVPPQTRIRMMTSHFSDYRNIRSAFALGGGRGRLPGTDEALHAGAQAQHLVQRRGDRRSISSVQMPSDSIRRNVSCTRSWVSGDSSSKPGSAIRSRSICEVGSNSRCLRSRTMVRSSSQTSAEVSK